MRARDEDEAALEEGAEGDESENHSSSKKRRLSLHHQAEIARKAKKDGESIFPINIQSLISESQSLVFHSIVN